jgi:hypothetical protein
MIEKWIFDRFPALRPLQLQSLKKQLDEDLAALTEKEYSDDHRGDNLMIDRWAAFLNLTHWFAWRGFEDVPPGYGKI